ncbi:MAG: quinone-dependent dihydroorotate dehydrogenase, partial [Acidimicrobiia bacterium]
MYRALRSIAFRFDPELVHTAGLLGYRMPRIHRRPSGGSVSTMGIEFPNVVGLAAGYDKDGRAWRGLAAIGFGHIEVGTVTPQPQAGNPRPRIFRKPGDRALINRMGFPNDGAETVASRLGGRRPDGLVLGVSIGPNGFSDPGQAALDYETLIDRFAPLADYLAVNVSSPNTPGLRSLESGSELEELLHRLVARRDRAVATLDRVLPLVVKLSPDSEDLVSTVAAIDQSGVDGVIVTNTTNRRPGVTSSESGGLSGAPLGALSLETLRRVRELTELPLI